MLAKFGVRKHSFYKPSLCLHKSRRTLSVVFDAAVVLYWSSLNGMTVQVIEKLAFPQRVHFVVTGDKVACIPPHISHIISFTHNDSLDSKHWSPKSQRWLACFNIQLRLWYQYTYYFKSMPGRWVEHHKPIQEVHPASAGRCLRFGAPHCFFRTSPKSQNRFHAFAYSVKIIIPVYVLV